VILTEAQIKVLEQRITEAHLLSALIAEVRHHRENAGIPVFVCPECNADQENGFSCGEDYTGPGDTVTDGGGSHDIGNIVSYNWVCMNCDSRGNIVWKTSQAQ